jgi:hypothetical protein
MNNNQLGSMPPPPSGFVPDTSTPDAGANSSGVSNTQLNTSASIPPPPAGFVPDTSTAPASASRQYQDNSYLDINPDDSLGMKALKGTNAIGAGLGEGLLGTLNGGADLLHLPHATLQARENELHEQNAQNPFLRGTGIGAENLLEFLSGDEMLKGLTTSQKYLKVGKLLEQVESSPVMTRIINAGVRALRGGVVGGIQGEIKSGGDTGTAIASGLGAGLGNAVIPEAFDAIKAAPGAIKGAYNALSEALQGAEKVVQPELQGSISKILSDVAADHGITIPDGTALRDTAEHVGTSIKGRASVIYQAIDDALEGTNLKSIEAKLENTQRALRDDTGVDHDYTGKLLEHESALNDQYEKFKQEAIAKGVKPEDFQNADRYWKQGSALQDLSAKIRQSTSGLPDNIRGDLKAPGEVISPSKLAPRIHALRDSGRLSQALTRDLSASRGNDLLRSVEGAKARTADIGNTGKVVGKVASGVAHAAGLGGGALLAGDVIRHVAGN